MDIIISDASPMINLSRLNHIEILFKLYSNAKIIVPKKVWEELEIDDNLIKILEENKVVVEDLTDEEMEKSYGFAEEIAFNLSTTKKLEALDPNKHMGEACAICLALKLKKEKDFFDVFLLLDEIAARTIAKREGLYKIGYFDIILDSFQQSLIGNKEFVDLIKYGRKKGIIPYKAKYLIESFIKMNKDRLDKEKLEILEQLKGKIR